MSPRATSRHPLNTSRDDGSTISLGSLLQGGGFDNPFCEEISSNIQSEHPLAQLEAIPFVLSSVTWEKRGTPTSLLHTIDGFSLNRSLGGAFLPSIRPTFLFSLVSSALFCCQLSVFLKAAFYIF